MPVLARGGDYVFAQDLNQVARFAGIDYASTPTLPPGELLRRLARILRAAVRYGGQIPSERLGDKLPGRDRSYLGLLNHIPEIAAGFVDITRGASLSGAIAAAEPQRELSVSELSARTEEIVAALDQWWRSNDDPLCLREVDTYYGAQTLHAVLERTTWHCGQHVRQLMMVLDILDIVPNDPLGAQDFEGLPMPENVWDG